MADFTSVGLHLSVGADASPDAVSGYDVIVLVAAERQHAGDSYDARVLRCPLPDVDDPTTAVIAKAQACAELVAFLSNPFGVSSELWLKFRGRMSMAAPMYENQGEPTEVQPERVLVTCLEGENRSLFVAGMALVLSGEQPDGKAAREHLELLRGPQSFRSPGYKRALDKFYPAELLAYRAPKTERSSRGMILR